MNIRKVTLNKGPLDGTFSMASHATAVVQGEIYVQDGEADPDHFVHALTLMRNLPLAEAMREKEAMKQFMANPAKSPVPDIPDWRLNMWAALFQYGAIE